MPLSFCSKRRIVLFDLNWSDSSVMKVQMLSHKAQVHLKYTVVVAAAIDRYLVMFPEDKRSSVKSVVQWAMETFKKQDRITWFIKKYREDPKIFDEHKTNFEHFMAMEAQISKLKNYRFEDKKKVSELIQDLKEIEQETLNKKGETLVSAKGEKIVAFGDGWSWWNLGVESCVEEAGGMGHCGNEPSKSSGDRLLSLRKEILIGDQTKYSSHLTFVLNKGILGEMKGRANERPAQKYHKYITELLIKYPEIKHVWGGGYQPHNNFQFSELTDAEQKAVLKAKPDINLQSPTKEIDVENIYPASKDQGLLFFPPTTKKHFTEFQEHNKAVAYIKEKLGDKASDPQNWLSIKPEATDPESSIVPFIIKNVPQSPELQKYLEHYIRDGAEAVDPGLGAKGNMMHEIQQAALMRNKDQALFEYAAFNMKNEGLKAYAADALKDEDKVKKWIEQNPTNRYMPYLVSRLSSDDYKINFITEFNVLLREEQKIKDLEKIFDSLSDAGKKKLSKVKHGSGTGYALQLMRDKIVNAMAIDPSKDWMDKEDVKENISKEQNRERLDRLFTVIKDDQEFIKNYAGKGKEEWSFNNSYKLLSLIEDQQFLKNIYLDKTAPVYFRLNANRAVKKDVLTNEELFKLVFENKEDIRQSAFFSLKKRRPETDALIGELALKTKYKNMLGYIFGGDFPAEIYYKAFKNKLVEEPGKDAYRYHAAMRALTGKNTELKDIVMGKKGQLGLDLIRHITDPETLQSIMDKHPEPAYKKAAERRLAQYTAEKEKAK